MKKVKIQSERRFWMEGGKAVWEDVVCESAGDLRPLPNKCRIVVVNDKVETILSQEIIDNDIMDVELMKPMCRYSLNKSWEIEDRNENNN